MRITSKGIGAGSAPLFAARRRVRGFRVSIAARGDVFVRQGVVPASDPTP